jgi:hypothetical protein
VVSVAAIAKAQEQQPPTAQAQPAAPEVSVSVAEAARKSRAGEDKPKARRVYTDEDMPSLTGPVSVVGAEKSEPASADAQKPASEPPGSGEAKSGKKDEAYWRGRYQALRMKMDAIDKKIADLQEEIKKYGNGGGGTDPPKGPGVYSNSTCTYQVGAYGGQGGCAMVVHDRESQLKDLEKQKADVQNQMDQLQEEARKSGVDPGWLR